MKIEEKIEYGQYLINEISNKFLLVGQPYIILEGYEYLREVITLYAKQTNLFESTILLLENNHAEEAFILVRSMLNNGMLVDYLINDNPDRERYKNYAIQPTKSELTFLYNIKKAITRGWVEELQDIDTKIENYEKLLIEEGFVTNKGKVDKQLLTVTELANQDKLLFGMYMMFYREGSQYEHSDITSLSIYRKVIDEEIPNTHAFLMDLSKTDETLQEKVLNLSLTIYGLTFVKLLKHISSTNEHLIRQENKLDLLKLLLQLSSTNFLNVGEIKSDDHSIR
jgi:hypothetical protein